ncbi:SPFH domain / Band 7 domain containing protein [Acanthamoeba castellanii str. Neff]|uniref:SPFH domain / Band 7 domain containing protein n=1 Tax=Acanthamoeba castellanii (strain ATCC 30010 / Neff) TaxID=1257118 RepID=L8H7L0_ACACF|nr:SPFH domain / Band 7 domain containing protein [Acanthamoeba castellanii str. Neff]ELR20718.1 SPFH domain / Band 7 domain containing protein [Acanthamoeba castellanii str. Neff]
MNIQDSGSGGYKQLQAGGGAGTGSDLGFQTSTNTRIEDGVSLLDALEDLGFVQSSSACGALGVGLVACTGLGALYVLSKMQLIQEGSMGLTLHSGQPVILRPGRYVLLSPLHSFVEQKSINDDLIEFGPITVVTIKKGQLGLSWKNGETIILEPGRHILVAPHVFQEAKDIGAPYIELGPIKRIIVNEGQVGISYDTGKLEVLLPGLHIRTSPTFRFQEFVSVRRLEPLKVNTNDGIAIMVNTIITYRIEDPVRAFRDVSNVSEALFEKAEALVTSIFLHHSLDEIAPTLPSGRHESLEDPGFGSDDDQDDNDKDDELTRRKKKKMGKQREISTPSLFSEIVREAFMDELREYVTTWGVVLMDMSIEKLEFHDSALRDLLTQRASNKLQTASNRANIAAQAQTGIQKAQGLAQEARVKADAELYTAEQRAKGARLQADTALARQLAVMRATREIVEAAGNKTSFIPWNMKVDLREGSAGSDHGYHLSDASSALSPDEALARNALVGH